MVDVQAAGGACRVSGLGPSVFWRVGNGEGKDTYYSIWGFDVTFFDRIVALGLGLGPERR